MPDVFRNLLERYKSGNATPEESALVREEIEKLEAINHFLAEEFNEELPSIEKTDDVPSAKKLSRKVTFKLFRTVLLVVLSICVLAAAVVGGCNLYFYNPNSGIQPVYGGDGQLLVDMKAFTELHSPGYTTYQAKAWRNGPGSYQLWIQQQNLFKGETERYSEQIVRGKALGNDSGLPNDYWHFPLMNAFGDREGKFSYEEGGKRITPSTEEQEKNLNSLAQLPESSRAAVYVTLSKDLTLEQFADLYEKWNGKLEFFYAAIVSDDKYMTSTIGFSPDFNGTVLEENAPDEAEYPYFQLPWSSVTQAEQPEIWSKHFHSLLRYLSTRKKFLDAMTSVNGIRPDYYRRVLDYVNKNGTNVYGVLISGSTKDVQAFLAQEGYYDFYVNGVRLSIFPD